MAVAVGVMVGVDVLVGDGVCVSVGVAVLVGVGVSVAVGVAVAGTPQAGSLNVPMRVRQLYAPFVDKYSLVYQNVQSSTGSTVSEL